MDGLTFPVKCTQTPQGQPQRYLPPPTHTLKPKSSYQKHTHRSQRNNRHSCILTEVDTGPHIGTYAEIRTHKWACI